MLLIMWPHFRHLLGHAFDTSPSLVSSNWAAVLMAIGVFLLSQILFLVFRGWEEMKHLWKESIAVGTVSVIVGWLVLYAWSIVVTVYHDHQNLTGRLGAVVTEKNALKHGLNDRDQYIKRLEQSLAQASTKQPAKAVPRIVPFVSQTPSATQPIIQPVIQPTSELERLNAINGRMTRADREQFSAALIDYSHALDRGDALLTASAQEGNKVDRAWHDGSIVQDFAAHKAALLQIAVLSKQFAIEFLNMREK
jgi:hypothetical protein